MEIDFENIEKQVKEKVKKKEPKQEQIEDLLVPTGSTLYNLALSGHHHGGYKLGTIANLVGDSDSGKTFIVMTTLAKMANDERFDEYELCYDDSEHAMSFNMEYLFGKKASKRITSPYSGKPIAKLGGKKVSETIQDLRATLFRKLDKGKPLVYVLDSLDSLTTTEEQKRYKDAYTKKKKKSDDMEDNEANIYETEEMKGSWKLEKPKLASELLRILDGPIEDTKSLFIVISQTRSNIGYDSTYIPKTKSGGKAWKFYCTHEIWASGCGKIGEKGKPAIGIKSLLKVAKSKLTGMKRECVLPIYYDLGVDEVQSCVDYLLKNNWWKRGTIQGEKTKFGLTEFDKKLPKSEIVEFIESNKLENELSEIVGKCWNEIEESLKLKNRTRRFE